MLSGTNSVRNSSFGACSETASDTSLVFAEFVDHRHETGGRQRDALVGETETEIVAHHAHRAHDVVEIEQRLAHAHHHDVGELALKVRHVAEMFRRDENLADDFRGGKIAVETLRAGRTEAAVQSTPDLRRNAQRAASGFGNEHGFDGAAAVHAEQPFVRGIGGLLLEHRLRRNDLDGALELIPQGFADIRHLREIGDVAMINPLHHLLGAIRFFAELLEQIAQTLAIVVEQIGFRCRH